MNWDTQCGLRHSPALTPPHSERHQEFWPRPGQRFTLCPEGKSHPEFLFKVSSVLAEGGISPAPHRCSLPPVLGPFPPAAFSGFEDFSSWLAVTLSNTTPVFMFGDFSTNVGDPCNILAFQFLDLFPFPLALFSPLSQSCPQPYPRSGHFQ